MALAYDTQSNLWQKDNQCFTHRGFFIATWLGLATLVLCHLFNQIVPMRLFILLLLLSVSAIGQDIPKGADVIEITSALNDADLYKLAGQVLIQQGYTISKSDRDFFQLQTDAKQIKGSNANPRLMITILGGKATIIGWLGAPLTPLQQTAYSPIRAANRGMPKSPLRLTFEEMNRYAIALFNATEGSILYKVGE